MPTNKLTRTAMLLALTLVFQSLRLIWPVPGVALNFIIGSLVNTVLLTASATVGIRAGFLIAWAAPVTAYLQGMLPLPVFIVPVAAGNMVYIMLFCLHNRTGFIPATLLAAAGKTLCLYFSFRWLLTFIDFPAKAATALLTAMSWPQLITAVAGAVLSKIIVTRWGKK